MTSPEAVAASMIDELRSSLGEVQRETGGSLEEIYGMRNSLQASRESDESDPDRVAKTVLNAAYIVLAAAEIREFESQSPIAPVSKLVPFDTLASRLDRVLQSFDGWVDGDPQRRESAVSALLEVHAGLNRDHPSDREIGLLVAAALLIAGAARDDLRG